MRKATIGKLYEAHQWRQINKHLERVLEQDRQTLERLLERVGESVYGNSTNPPAMTREGL